MKGFIKRYFEAYMVLLAAKILMGRNASRSSVVSRKDNNAMWYMAEGLEGIAKRMMTKYES